MDTPRPDTPRPDTPRPDTPRFDGLSSHSTTFTCTICCEEYTDTFVIIQDDSICKDCFTSGVKPQFEAAIKDESQYPVRWGGAELQISDFASLLHMNLLGEFVEKRIEYAVLPKERLYCAGRNNSAGHSGLCSHFLGRKISKPTSIKCEACGERTCSCCGTLVSGFLVEHRCSDSDNVEDTLKDLKRGTDYQKCPNCDGIVQLQDGCNHLICRVPACGQTHFCYICGEEAGEGSGHWDAGKPCPKYNQPGASNAMFDAPGAGQMGPLFGFFDPVRRQAMTTLAARAREDTAPDSIQADDSPEVRLRKLDRRELDRISLEAERIETDRINNQMEQFDFNLNNPGGAPPLPAWLTGVMDFTHVLSNLVELYTIHLETNEMIKEIVTQARDAVNDEIPFFLEEVGEEGFARFPTLQRIVDTYALAVKGEIEELRRQTRD